MIVDFLFVFLVSGFWLIKRRLSCAFVSLGKKRNIPHHGEICTDGAATLLQADRSVLATQGKFDRGPTRFV